MAMIDTEALIRAIVSEARAIALYAAMGRIRSFVYTRYESGKLRCTGYLEDVRLEPKDTYGDVEFGVARIGDSEAFYLLVRNGPCLMASCDYLILFSLSSEPVYAKYRYRCWSGSTLEEGYTWVRTDPLLRRING